MNGDLSKINMIDRDRSACFGRPSYGEVRNSVPRAEQTVKTIDTIDRACETARASAQHSDAFSPVSFVFDTLAKRYIGYSSNENRIGLGVL